MDWFQENRPKNLDEYITNREQVNKAIKWIKDYKNNVDNTKNVLFIIGGTGIGKTLLADLIFKEFNYQKIELNSTDIRSQKKLGEFLRKSLTFKNVVDMFYEGNQPIGILMDEIDTICKLSDKGGMSEFLDILKQNEKIETNKKKNKKVKIFTENYIKLYNPIICTSNDINDKKINELKKYSEVIYLNKPCNDDLKIIIKNILNKNNYNYDENVLDLIADYCLGDLRQLIQIIGDILSMTNLYEKKYIDKDIFLSYTYSFDKKFEDVQLIDSTKLLLTNKMEICKSQLLFDIDCLLTPLMIYHNSLNYIKNCEDPSKNKLKTYKDILESLCIHDTIQTNIFEAQDWNELYDIASIYGSSLPNFYFTQLKNKKDITVEFTSLLNKISQMYVNKKLLNSAKYSIGKLNYDNDEIIYITEIISNYFDNYKVNLDEDDEENNKNIESKKKITKQGKKTKKDKKEIYIEDEDIELTNDTEYSENSTNLLENSENKELFSQEIINKDKISINSKYVNSELILFMNKYKIGIDELENILKIEKLNRINEKRKKKFTLKIKKDISNYL
jgi:hypothetical protein